MMKKYTKPEINIKKLSAWDIIQTSGLEDMGVGSENGEIVIALIDDEATCKTFYKENGHYRLQPENDKYEPIVGSDNIKVLGKVISVFRML